MTTPRDLRDRLGEALRRARHGLMRPLWADMTVEQCEPWRAHADLLVEIARDVGVEIKPSEQQ